MMVNLRTLMDGIIDYFKLSEKIEKMYGVLSVHFR
jgi:hypothetical protein